MTTKTETGHAEAFMVSEANGTRSRASVTLISGQDLAAGSVLSIITASGKYTKYLNTGSTGTETAKAILVDDCDASGGDKTCAIVMRDAEVAGDNLNWNSVDQTGINAGIVDLASVGILVR